MAVRDHLKIGSLEARLAQYDAGTVVEHNFTVLAELSDHDFAYYSDEEPGGGAWRPCLLDKHNGVDTAALLHEAIGYTAIVAKWEERGTCKSILRADLGFDWRNKSNQFKYAKGK